MTLQIRIAQKINPHLFYGWIMLAVGFLGLLDRFRTSTVVSAGILMNAVALWLLYIADSMLLAGVYAVVMGATQAAAMTNASYIWPRFFGRKHLSGIQGTAFTVAITGAAVGPLPFGIAYDVFGGYHEAVLGLSLLPVIFGVAVFFSRPPHPRRSAKRGAGHEYPLTKKVLIFN